MSEKIIPFHTYLLKIASRCNINCTYCYIYNQADDRWSRQPKLMSSSTAHQTARRIREHITIHGKSDCNIVLHGGEPLMGGVKHIAAVVEPLLHELTDQGVEVSLGMQSNGLLFDRNIGDFFRAHGITIGISLDGPKEVNDQYRVDHQGRPTTEELEPRIRLLTSEYADIFAGFLCVINPYSDPIEVIQYLLSYNPPSIDFIFPFNNHDALPKGKVGTPDATLYGDWLIAAYDYWAAQPHAGPVRIFRSIINMWLGAPTLVESLGLLPVDIVVIETNGEIEGVDSLKATYQGATELGFDVFTHEFDEVAAHAAVVSRQNGAKGLCETCRACEIVNVCGGGYLPHRYSEARNFDNPSIYCADLKKLIPHIGESVVASIQGVNPAI